MADEAQLHLSLQITKGNLQYANKPTAFKADVSGTKGPVPGAVEISVAGTDIDFSELTTPRWATLRNLDGTNFVTYGVWDPDNGKFFPLGELLPGETNIISFSRDLQEEFGTGSGTTGAAVNRFRMKANTAVCNVSVEAFEASA